MRRGRGRWKPTGRTVLRSDSSRRWSLAGGDGWVLSERQREATGPCGRAGPLSSGEGRGLRARSYQNRDGAEKGSGPVAAGENHRERRLPGQLARRELTTVSVTGRGQPSEGASCMAAGCGRGLGRAAAGRWSCPRRPQRGRERALCSAPAHAEPCAHSGQTQSRVRGGRPPVGPLCSPTARVSWWRQEAGRLFPPLVFSLVSGSSCHPDKHGAGGQKQAGICMGIV